jgi:hypothetical protein
VLQQGEEPMGQVSLVELDGQGGAIAGDDDGIGRERMADEVSDGKMHLMGEIGPPQRQSNKLP